jgi:serine/threonine protein kinase
MHKLGVMHRNLKLKSCAVEIGSSIHVKLTKFNLATFDEDSRERVGTTRYLAPEILKKQKYSCEVDIWAIGKSPSFPSGFFHSLPPLPSRLPSLTKKKTELNRLGIMAYLLITGDYDEDQEVCLKSHEG